MGNKEIWPCRYANHCVFCCSDGNPDVCGKECYLTTDRDLKVPGEYTCEVPDARTIVISYHSDANNLKAVVAALLSQEEPVTFRQIHYICTNEQPGSSTSNWPLIWNGCVQCDGKTLTFEFVERKDTDDKV